METSLREITEFLEKMDARNEIRFQGLTKQIVRLAMERFGSDEKIKELHEDVVAMKMGVKELQKTAGRKE